MRCVKATRCTSIQTPVTQGPLDGGCSNGRGFPIRTCPSRFVLFCPFLGTSQSLSGFFPILSEIFPIWPFSSLSAYESTYTRNIPERVRDQNQDLSHRKWETPRFGTPPLMLCKTGMFMINTPWGSKSWRGK